MAYDELEPIGEIRDDWRIGVLCALVANMVRPKSRRPYSPAEFMWQQPGAPKKKQSAEELKAVFMGIMEAQNKRVAAQEKRARKKRKVADGV